MSLQQQQQGNARFKALSQDNRAVHAQVSPLADTVRADNTSPAGTNNNGPVAADWRCITDGDREAQESLTLAPLSECRFAWRSDSRRRGGGWSLAPMSSSDSGILLVLCRQHHRSGFCTVQSPARLTCCWANTEAHSLQISRQHGPQPAPLVATLTSPADITLTRRRS